MNRKLRVLMLSLFVVLFSAVSAFATDFALESSDTTSASIEGYNYRTVIVTNPTTAVSSWDVKLSGDTSSISWLKWTPGSDSSDLVIEGRLPAFSATASYDIIVTAYSGDTVGASMDFTISVDKNPRQVVVSSDLVSINVVSSDATTVTSTTTEYKATTGYSATITFKVSSDKFMARLLSSDTGTTVSPDLASIDLPSWLAYKVDTYSKDLVSVLHIVYSADTAPADGTLGSVRIPVLLSDDKTSVDIGWNITFSADAASSTSSAISFDVSSCTITAVYGTATVYSEDLTYHNQKPVSIVFSPDISADVTISAASTDAATSSDANAGYVTLTITPVKSADATYTTTMIATDADGNTAKVTLNITVTSSGSSSSMAITPVSSSITVDVGKSKDVTFTATSFDSKVSAWTLGTVPSGITVTSSDSGTSSDVLTVTVVGVTSGDYSFDIKATDASSNTASAVLYVKVLPAKSGDVGLKIDPVSNSVTVTPGGSIVNVKFTALDASGDVAWSLGTLPRGVTMVEANKSGDVVTYGVSASADAPATAGTNVTITASDDVKTATATLTIIVSGDVVSASLRITPSAPTVTVAVGDTQNVSLTASNNSGRVTWTAGTPTGNFTIEAATDTSYATQEMTQMVYTVTGVTAGTGSVTVTATDAGGKTANVTINVTVTGGAAPTVVSVDLTPSITITDALRTALRDTLAALLGIDLSNVKVAYLADGLIGGSLSANVATANVVQFSEIRVSEDGIYLFGLPTDNMTVGYTLIWEVTVTNAANDALLEASATDEDNAVFLDKDGNQITKVPTDKDVTIAAYFEAGKTYTATVRAERESETGTDTGIGSANSGCSAGFGALVSALAAAFFISRKRS